MKHYDLIIVGGGLVGAGLALALKNTEIKIALIDAKLPTNNDPRLFALNASSCQFLQNIDVWPVLEEYAASIQQVHVSNHGQFGAVRLRAEETGFATLGNVLPAYQIEMAFANALDLLAHCTIYRPARLMKLQQENQLAQLTLTTEQGEMMLQSPLVIGADGTESTVRKQLNIAAEIIDYDQSAIVTRTTLKRHHENIAYERFYEQGAIAMLPLKGNECATIWSGANARMQPLMSLTDDDFVLQLQRIFGYRMGKLQSIGKRHMFPLRMVKAENAYAGCVYLLGNSAHTLHPIAAQGFNLAIHETAMLAEYIQERLAEKKTLSAIDLQSFHAKTLRRQAVSMGVSHRLSQLFSSESMLAELAAQIGMLSLDLLAPVKKRFVREMLGKTGDVPRLLI